MIGDNMILPSIKSLSDLNGYNPRWCDLTTFPVPFTDLIGYNNGSETRATLLKTHFVNTRFHAKSSDVHRKLVIVAGESWTYGGKIRDMSVYPEKSAGHETPNSFTQALDTTFGALLARMCKADLHQDAYPGNNTSYIFDAGAEALDYHLARDEYDDIIVVLQVTDCLREESQSGGIKPHHHVYDMFHESIGDDNIGRTWPSPEAWLYEYEEGFLKLADAMLAKSPRVKQVMVWKNFSGWALPKETLDKYNSTVIRRDWTRFLADYEGIDLPFCLINNPGAIDVNNPYLSLTVSSNMDTEFVNKWLPRCETLHDYWEYMSNDALGLCVNYPNAQGHAMWAQHLRAHLAPDILDVNDRYFSDFLTL